MPDCGDNSCIYAGKRGGMRTNGGCQCDDCPECGKTYRRWKPGKPQHYQWCLRQDWIPDHHRAPAGTTNESKEGA
jgi:hypothetical protein